MGENAKPRKEIPKLTAYECQRNPQDVSNYATESAVTPRSLHNELMCPICLEIMKKTMTTKECLHRFCAICISTALRSGNKECPTCRKKLVSKRSLRPDVRFDLLISQIYPNLDEYEAEQDRNIAILNSSYMQTLAGNMGLQEKDNCNTSNQISQNINNANNKLTKKRRQYFSISQHLASLTQEKKCESDSNLPENSNNKNQIDESVVSSEIEIILKPHPLSESITNGETRFLKTTSIATVNHIKKYLILRLNLNDNSSTIDEANDINHETLNNVCMYIANSPNNFTALNGLETLQQLGDTFSKRNGPLEMYYVLTQK